MLHLIKKDYIPKKLQNVTSTYFWQEPEYHQWDWILRTPDQAKNIRLDEEEFLTPSQMVHTPS